MEQIPDKQNVVELRTLTLTAGETHVLRFDPVPETIVIAQVESGGDILVQYGVMSRVNDGLRLMGRMSASIPGRSALSITANTNSIVSYMLLTNLEGGIE